MVGKNAIEIVDFFVLKEKIPTLIGLNFMGSLGTKIEIEEGHGSGSQLKIGGKQILMTYDGSHYTMDLKEIGDVLGSQIVTMHVAEIPNDVTVELNKCDQTKTIEELNDEIERVYKVSTPELKDEYK